MVVTALMSFALAGAPAPQATTTTRHLVLARPKLHLEPRTIEWSGELRWTGDEGLEMVQPLPVSVRQLASKAKHRSIRRVPKEVVRAVRLHPDGPSRQEADKFVDTPVTVRLRRGLDGALYVMSIQALSEAK